MSAAVQRSDDVCALPLVRRMAALLDRDPDSFSDGDALPRGWHVAFFNPPTRQSLLRHDGAAQLGVTLPDLGLPRLMMGGRRIEFVADIPIGARLQRSSLPGAVTSKTGKSGRFALVDVEQRISLAGSASPLVIETISYVLREEDKGAGAAANLAVTAIPAADAALTITPDETMLFRYSAITDNPHRIHYDLPYALSEGYPSLIVNGTVPSMLLLEMFRAHVGAEPAGWQSRNLAPILCGAPLALTLTKAQEQWSLRAYGANGGIALDAKAWQ